MSKKIFKRFFPYLKIYKKEIFFALFSGIICGATSVLITYFIGKSVDTMTGLGKVDLTLLISIIGLIALLIITNAISQWFVQVLGNRVAYLSVAELRKDMFNHLNTLPLKYFDNTSHGNILSRFTNDLDYVSEATTAIFNNIFSGMTIVIISLITMLVLNMPLTLVVIIGTILIFIVNYIVAKTSQSKFMTQQKIVGDISGYISEIVGNQKIVKAFQYENRSQKTFENINSELYTVGKQAQFASSLTNPLSRFIDHISYLSIGLVGGLLVLNSVGNVTVGLISSFIIYSTQFSKPFIELSGIMTQIQSALAGLQRTFEIIDEKPETPDTNNILNKEKLSGKVEFKNVYFSYTKNQPLIENFNLLVEPGESIAIVGKTGAGKSTLVNLLMRFYDVDSGEITIDNVPIKNYSRDSLRRAFGMVLQDTWLFDGTIKDNLIFGNPKATDNEIIEACKASSIHSFIEKLPNGYNTVIGQGGLKISDGQSQLLTIARTMISKPPMLILDEATSSVDTLTEIQIQTAFLNMMKGKTSFIIAHRLSTIREADKILVMDSGKIVEVGNHKELLNKKDSYYGKLYKAQFENIKE
ncbi:ABC transporter ATP-binding protein [Miniphocaeibacter halophilus]|uniref:ABC transporter ATP-binding protein n=1 Tax=Miniphocaeibacter halophilus TaxID=2931922 RepID=A0AC61MR12_9FIRM|nr:ABC transporter ATP-binding protein [Miniphocaeibacter halophilus]QQK06874.1 ABC transporter ATP-binding protein [Miniphocaeibacter halophilus]